VVADFLLSAGITTFLLAMAGCCATAFTGLKLSVVVVSRIFCSLSGNEAVENWTEDYMPCKK